MHKFIIPLFALAFLLVSCKPEQTPPEETRAPAMEETAPEEPEAEEEEPAPEDLGPYGFDGQILSGMHHVVLKTSMGDIAIELNADAAPKSVTNFVTLAKAGYFNGLIFHRVIPGFMLQGGDPNGNGTGGESIFGETFEDEINAGSYGLNAKTLREAAQGQELPEEIAKLTIQQYYEQQGYVYSSSLRSLPMKRGALAMANRGPNTNASQFFIIQAEGTPWLEGKHTVFGMVTEGMDVVDAIIAVQRDGNDKPLEPVTYNVEVVD